MLDFVRYRRSIVRSVVGGATAVAMAAISPLACAQPAPLPDKPFAEHRIALQLSDNDPGKQGLVISVAYNLLKFYDPDKGAIEVGRVEPYCQVLGELDLRLVKAVDTHLHADHVTGLGELRDRTHCVTIMGEQSKADVVAMRVTEGDRVTIEGLGLDVMYPPGHTDDSYSYLMGDRVFTGDTLLIRGTGRTDFQNGSARAQYDSIFNPLLKRPGETPGFPAHDYKGDTVSTIGEEKRYNPRLQVRSIDEYVELMGNLKLPNPKMMDVVVPANMHVGLHQDDLAKQGLALSAREGIDSLGRPDLLLVDLREDSERAKNGTLPGALHPPYPTIGENLKASGMLRQVA